TGEEETEEEVVADDEPTGTVATTTTGDIDLSDFPGIGSKTTGTTTGGTTMPGTLPPKASAKKLGSTLPTSLQNALENAKAGGTSGKFLQLASDMGMPIRALGDIGDSPVNKLEGMYHFPFATPELGGVDQANYNILSRAGYSPSSGNPYAKFLQQDIMPSLYYSASVKAAMEGRSPNEVDLANEMMEMVKGGRVSAIDDAPGAIRQLAGSLQGGAEPTGPMAMLAPMVADEDNAARLVEALLAPSVSPFLRAGLRRTLANRVMRYRQQAPSQPSVGPLPFLAQSL
ncbi:MAG TPA: hypothetical protein VEI97_14320, partial [bacterium]|nr:hypothetical protein [bacterium]